MPTQEILSKNISFYDLIAFSSKARSNLCFSGLLKVFYCQLLALHMKGCNTFKILNVTERIKVWYLKNYKTRTKL